MSKKPHFATNDLLEALDENIKLLRTGDRTPAVSNAIATSAGTMLRILKLRIEYGKLTGQVPEIPGLGDGK